MDILAAMNRLLLCLGALCMTACGGEPGWNGSLEKLLKSQPERFGVVMDDPERYRVQIIYTQIDRDGDNRPSFRSFTYRLDPEEYFYPASTVKLPTAALALEKLNQLGIKGLDRDTVMLTGRSADFHTEAVLDETSPIGLPTVAQYIRKILVVSDNDAFNRLYEFLGQDPLNEAMASKGYAGTRIIHRLEVALNAETKSPHQPGPVHASRPGRIPAARRGGERGPSQRSPRAARRR